MWTIYMMIGGMATHFMLFIFYFIVYKKSELLYLLAGGLSLIIFILLILFPEFQQEWQSIGLKFTFEIRNAFVFFAAGFYYKFVLAFLDTSEKKIPFDRIIRISAIVLIFSGFLYVLRNLLGEDGKWMVVYFYLIFFLNFPLQGWFIFQLFKLNHSGSKLIAWGSLLSFGIMKFGSIPMFKNYYFDNNLSANITFILFALSIIFLFFSFALIHQIGLKNKDLLAQQLDRAESLYQQRVEISNDLHDDLGATLSSLHIYASIAQKQLGVNPAKTKQNLDLISKNVFTLMEKINDVIWSVSTSSSNVSQLSTRIKDSFLDVFDTTGMHAVYEIDEDLESCITGLKARKLLLLFAKEAINNAIKHSGADTIRFSIKKVNENLHMSIKDNGKGIGKLDFNKGNGISNLKYRADQLDGHFSVETLKPNGTLVECIIPLTSISL